MNGRRRALALVLALGVGGCVPIGKDFVRPDDSSLKLGKSTFGEVRERYGAPRTEKSWARTDAELAAEVGAPFGVARVSGVMRELDYYHEDRMGKPAAQGVQPSKSARFWFFEDHLVGYLSHSSFLADSSGFDESRISSIVPWQTLRAQVVATLGAPAGVRVYPMVRQRGHELLTYFSFEFDRASNQTRMKRLHVLVNALGVVEDTRFESSAKPIPPPPAPAMVPIPIYIPPPRTIK